MITEHILGRGERTVYILCNARVDPEWSEVERRTLSITFKAIATLIEYHVIGDVYRIYDVTKRDGTDFNLAYIPETFKVPHTTQFDTAYIRQLYEFGLDRRRRGIGGRSSHPRWWVSTRTTRRRSLFWPDSREGPPST